MKLLTANEVALRLGYSREHITRLAKAGKIPGARKDDLTGWWLIPETAIGKPPLTRKGEKNENEINSYLK